MFTVSQLKQTYSKKLTVIESNYKRYVNEENERHESRLLDLRVRYQIAKKELLKWFNTTEAVEERDLIN